MIEVNDQFHRRRGCYGPIRPYSRDHHRRRRDCSSSYDDCGIYPRRVSFCDSRPLFIVNPRDNNPPPPTTVVCCEDQEAKRAACSSSSALMLMWIGMIVIICLILCKK
jgi:hypothetical protein